MHAALSKGHPYHIVSLQGSESELRKKQEDTNEKTTIAMLSLMTVLIVIVIIILLIQTRGLKRDVKRSVSEI